MDKLTRKLTKKTTTRITVVLLALALLTAGTFAFLGGNESTPSSIQNDRNESLVESTEQDESTESDETPRSTDNSDSTADSAQQSNDSSANQQQSTPADNSTLFLEGEATEDGVQLNWTIPESIEFVDALRVIYDTSNSNPTYGEHASKSIGSTPQTSNSDLVNLGTGDTYYIRICDFGLEANVCNTYSNTIKITTIVNDDSAVVNGTTTLVANPGDAFFKIQFTGTAPHGFKLLASTQENPTYPSDSIMQIDNTSEVYYPNVEPLSSNDRVYLKVCKYTGSDTVDGGCTDYSNQIEYIAD